MKKISGCVTDVCMEAKYIFSLQFCSNCQQYISDWVGETPSTASFILEVKTLFLVSVISVAMKWQIRSLLIELLSSIPMSCIFATPRMLILSCCIQRALCTISFSCSTLKSVILEGISFLKVNKSGNGVTAFTDIFYINLCSFTVLICIYCKYYSASFLSSYPFCAELLWQNEQWNF